jgi:hypothetical protein
MRILKIVGAGPQAEPGSKRARVANLLAELVELLVEDAPPKSDAGAVRYYTTGGNHPFPSDRAFLDAGRRGDFATYRLGRRTAARVEDVHAAIEAKRPRRRPRAIEAIADDDETLRAELAAQGGVRLRGRR